MTTPSTTGQVTVGSAVTTICRPTSSLPLPLHRCRPMAPAVRRADGSVSAFVAVLAVALLAVTGLVVDGGRALAAHTAAAAVAEQAARAGTAAIDATALHRGIVVFDPAEAVVLAEGFLARTGYQGVATATPEAVHVTVTTTVATTLLDIVGLRTLTVHASATAMVLHGVSQGG